MSFHAKKPTAKRRRKAMVESASKALLTYAPSTAPALLQVSASLTEPSVATVTIIISCPSDVGSVNVAQLMLALPVRDPNAPDSSELAMVAPPLSSVSIVSTGSDQWDVKPGAQTGAFVFTPKAGVAALESQALTIMFTGIEVSPLVGTATIDISEWASPGGAPPSTKRPPSGTGTIALTKFPLGFFAANFAGPVEVESSGRATLTWNASTNASCAIEYETHHVPVTGQSWPSPPLYSDTVFKLIASATQNQQTVSTSLTTTVQVANPIVVSFTASPDNVGYGQATVLTWLTSQADGVYLLSRTASGTHREASWPANSDPNDPVPIKPQLETSYELQAYRKGTDGREVTSEPRTLEFAFLPIEVRSFKADPPVISSSAPNTVVSWDIANAVEVKFQGVPVQPKDSHSDAPNGDTTYTLQFKWVDGSVETATTLAKHLDFSIDLRPADSVAQGAIVLTIDMTVAAESSVVLSPLTVAHSDWYLGATGTGTDDETSTAEIAATRVSDRQWRASASIPLHPLTLLPWVSSVSADVVVDGRRIPGAIRQTYQPPGD
jgi:hypothetical protein